MIYFVDNIYCDYDSLAGRESPCTEGSVSVVSNVFNSYDRLQLVEMCTSEGVWYSVCDIEWTRQDVTVVCRELGYSSWGTIIIISQSMYIPVSLLYGIIIL